MLTGPLGHHRFCTAKPRLDTGKNNDNKPALPVRPQGDKRLEAWVGKGLDLDGEYEAERIVDERRSGRKRFFRIKFYAWELEVSAVANSRVGTAGRTDLLVMSWMTTPRDAMVLVRGAQEDWQPMENATEEMIRVWEDEDRPYLMKWRERQSQGGRGPAKRLKM